MITEKTNFMTEPGAEPRDRVRTIGRKTANPEGWITISTMRPLPGKEDAVHLLNQQILEFARTLRGFGDGYVTRKCLGAGDELCRIILWENQGWAGLGAMALRYMESKLELGKLLQQGRAEQAFLADSPPSGVWNFNIA